MLIFVMIYVVLSIIVGIWEFFLAYQDQICCLLTLIGLLGMSNQLTYSINCQKMPYGWQIWV